jgi:hypothetical protein
MRPRTTIRVQAKNSFFAIAASVIVSAQIPAAPGGEACHNAELPIPRTAPGSMGGQEFARRVGDLQGSARDAEVRRALLAGNLPEHLRHLAPVTLEGRGRDGAPLTVIFCVMPDYLAVGSDSDSLIVPMGLPTALDVAAEFDSVLPTPRLVDAIYEAADLKLAPQPLPASDEMRSTAYLVRHDTLIAEQRALRAAPEDALTAGHKKDLVLSDRLLELPGRVAIYGWHWAARQPIQPLSTVHGARYADYSHGVRLVSRIIYLNGAAREFIDALRDPAVTLLLGGDGARIGRKLQGDLVSVLQQRNPK